MSADTSAVRAEEQLDLEALSAYLEREGFTRGQGISVEQFPGGHSNLTYLLKLDGAGEYVLRRPPLGPVAPKAHDMVREFGETYEDYRRRVPMLVPFTASGGSPQRAAEPRSRLQSS